MKNIIIRLISIVLFFINIYLYVLDPLEKHHNLIKILIGWVIISCILYFLFRHSGKLIVYIISTTLLALSYFLIPI
ncbi:hypothetical protein SAMN05444349_1684 [Bacteroides faecichinchillae]|uniref:Uncharacterized protein n=1 Tax=Bacteroides faecichinchillae TaxID=871325 RepID=A0A1M5GK78_9BACE|nr:hypothetical protein E5981_17335 [Bacteroides faecichinchillae]SHG04096.1 hypothetical protein SAMN05444349_1684 [Bacteroides faecichinchillae]